MESNMLMKNVCCIHLFVRILYGLLLLPVFFFSVFIVQVSSCMYWLFCILEVLRSISYNILWFTSNYRGVSVCLCVCMCDVCNIIYSIIN